MTHDMPSLDTWYLTIYTLSPDAWHLLLGIDTIDLMLWHSTGYYHTWHLYCIAYSWLSLLCGLDMIITLLPSRTPELMYSLTPIFLNSCILKPLKQGDSWYYTPDTILLLITVIGYSWILNYCEHTVDIIIGQFIIKYSTHTGMEKLMGINIASCL